MRSHPVQLQRVFRSLVTERWKWRVAVILVSLSSAISGLLAPYFQKRFIDRLMLGQSATAWVFAAFGAALAYQILAQVTAWLAVRESVYSQKSLGEALYHRLLHIRGALIGRGPAGEAVSLFAVDVPGSASLLDQCLATGASLFFPLLLSPLVLKRYFGIPLAWSLGTIAALAGINGYLAYRQSKFFHRYKALAAERTGLVSEWIQNIRALRILGWTQAAEARIFSTRLRETHNRVAMVTNGQLMNAIAGSATFTVNALAIWALVSMRAEAITPGELLALLWVLGVFLARPLRQFPWFFVIGLDSLSSVQRLEAAFAKEAPAPRRLEGPDLEGAAARPLARLPDEAAPPALEIEDLHLEIDGQPLLRSIDLRVASGELVAIVGEVGSGKSLLLQSLMGETGARFRSFRFDGAETDGPANPDVRARFAYVPQEGFTMSASLRENVVFEYDSPSDHQAKVLASLNQAEFPPAGEGLLHGIETEIGERGVNLSGGQRQRIGLARAHFSGRPVVLLDDCLSAVDVDTEKRLLEGLLLGAWKDLPRILVTHRMSVLSKCDRVVFLESGRIQMQGRHSELLISSRRYREFVDTAERSRQDSPQPEGALHV